MLQYPDLEIEDISYYWGHSTVMLEQGGKFAACYVDGVRTDKRYPIILNSVITGERVIALSLKAFIRRVLVHHPALGYGDYKGLPLYLSPRAGANLRKGVDNNNLTALCPFDWQAGVRITLERINKQAQKYITGGRATVPAELTAEYQRARNLYGSMQGLSRRGSLDQGRITVSDRKVTARVMEQSVNNRYPTIDAALKSLSTESDIHGVSVSRDFALLRTAAKDVDNISVYHRLTNIGSMSPRGGEFNVATALTPEARQCVELSFNRVLEK